MTLVDRIKFDATDESTLVWKYPSEDIILGTQLIVNQSQEVIFVKNGEALDLFGPGSHTLSTGNIPLLNKLINLPFGSVTPFTAEAWFINKTVKRDLLWGTPKPIQLIDPKLGFPISLRAFGKWGIRINDSRSFVAQLVGSRSTVNVETVERYLEGEIVQKLNEILASAVSSEEFSVFTMATIINRLSMSVAENIEVEFSRLGVELVNFNIESINIPEDELEKIQDVLGKKMEVEQLNSVQVGAGYTTVKTFDILAAAAESGGEGGSVVGGMLGAGIGLGAGFPIGQQLGSKLNVAASDRDVGDGPEDKLLKLKALFDDGLITEDQFKTKQARIVDEL